MDFKKLFKRNKTPDIVGKDAQQLDIPTELVTKIYLVFPKLDGQPTYELESKLTIGSEVGDVVLDDESVAPKHCTFTHVQDVISLMDHGSLQGTLLNKKAVTPGRVFILQDKDKLKIGDLEARILIQEEEVPLEEEIAPEVSDEDIDPAAMQRMQASASGALPDLPKAQEAPTEEPPELVDSDVTQDDATQDIEMPTDLSADEDMPDIPDLKDDDSNQDSIDNSDLVLDANDDEDDLLEEEVEKKPSLLARLFKKKAKGDEAQEEMSEAEITKLTKQIELGKIKEKDLDAKTRRILKASGAKKMKVKAKSSVPEASNTLGRVFALVLEVIIILFALTFLSGNKQFIDILDKYPAKIWAILVENFNKFGKVHYDQHAKVHVDKVLNDVPAISKAFAEVIEFVESHPQLLYGIYIFIVIRVVTPLLFGVSLGQAIIGIRSLGNFAVKRITGVFREFIGLFTAPLVILDFPALFSKRTFKEMLSFSHIATGSTMLTTILTFVWLFLFSGVYIAMPIIEKGVIPTPVPYEALDLKPVTIKLADDVTSKQLRAKGKLPENHIALPEFQVVQKDKKRLIQLAFKVLNIENGDFVIIKRKKEISLSDLLKKSIENNYLASWKYPEILKITHDASKVNKNFKQEEKLDVAKISPEIILLMKGAFGLSLETVHHHILLHGPFLKGYLNFKELISSMIDEKLSKVRLDYIGATPFMVLEGSNNKKITALSLNTRNANVYEFEVSKKGLSLDNFFEEMSFSESIEENKKSDIFFLADGLMDIKNLGEDEFQLLYEVLFEYSKKIVMSKDKFINEQLEKSLSSILEFVQMMESDKKDKFYQNTSDMLKAIKDGEMSFFGIQDVKAAGI
jgi:pSer/pThr/pTyr-binding forkhead associated (FHA) protein